MQGMKQPRQSFCFPLESINPQTLPPLTSDPMKCLNVLEVPSPILSAGTRQLFPTCLAPQPVTVPYLGGVRHGQVPQPAPLYTCGTWGCRGAAKGHLSHFSVFPPLDICLGTPALPHLQGLPRPRGHKKPQIQLFSSRMGKTDRLGVMS